MRHVAILAEPLSVDRIIAQVRDRQVGGIGLFIGLVRETDGEHDDVIGLDYTQHPTAHARLAEVAASVAERFDVQTVAVEHRIGHLEVGDLAVVVAVGAVHRAEALEACRALIDDLKRDVPIWKEQQYSGGAMSWVGLP